MSTNQLPQRVISFLQDRGWNLDYYVKHENLDYVWAKAVNPQVTLTNPIEWEMMGNGPLHPEIEFTYDSKSARAPRVKLDGGLYCTSNQAYWWGKPFGRNIFRVGESTHDEDIMVYLETLNQPLTDIAHLHTYSINRYRDMFFHVQHYYEHQHEIAKLEFSHRMAIRYFLYTYTQNVHEKMFDALRYEVGNMRVVDLVKLIYDTVTSHQFGTGLHHFVWAIDYLSKSPVK